MINSEKELEDYICNNQDKFIDKLKKIYCVKDIEFIGRQIKIGQENIADLVYLLKENEEIPINNLLIVELKFRELQCKDLAQITRYMASIEEKDMNLNFENVYGCFISFGCNDEMQDVLKYQNYIKSIELICNYDYLEESYSYTDEYLKKLKIDDRLKKHMLNSEEK